MAETDIGSAIASSDQHTDYSVSPQTTDGVSPDGLTRYNIRNWTQNLGYYKTIPELRAVIDARATWTVGKGFEAEPTTEMLLNTIKGIGNDSFNTILADMSRTADIAGDSFAEIVRDNDRVLMNLKPLDPSTIVIVADKNGTIKHYERLDRTGKPTGKKIPVEKILHFSRNRIADEIHGISLVDSLVEIILMRNEAMSDWKRVLHRNIDPLFVYHMDTDDTTEINAFKAKMDAARGKGENIYVPKGVIVPEVVGVSSNAILNSMTWIDNLNEYFYEVAGVPKIIIGSSRAFTEASAKIGYLAFQQTIEERQLYIEEQMLSQLNLEINLVFPASLENELISDNKKDVEEGATQPNDMEAGAGE